MNPLKDIDVLNACSIGAMIAAVCCSLRNSAALISINRNLFSDFICLRNISGAHKPVCKYCYRSTKCCDFTK